MKRAFCVFAAVLSEQRSVSVRKMFHNLKDWKFRSPPSYAELPIDENPEYNVPVAVKNAVFSKVPTEPLTGNIRLVCASEDALINLLDLDPSVAETEDFIDFVNGKFLPDGGLTVSHRYGGYQFGFWADQLGDGRAHILGEYVNSKGEMWQPQLKGSGETPYSRFGDGRAVLRSSIREMIASEACHYLGIPTTRAAALVVSDEPTVWRDKSYTGHSRKERGAIVMRVAPSWYRIGSIEIMDKRKEPQIMKTLVDFIIKYHFPEIEATTDEDKYVKWYKEVAIRNLDMVATWQGLGFTHGVLNTDNISLMGLTIDYGPYGFIDHYYHHYVPNTSDDLGRYAFNRQPEILLWNLEKFAQALEPVLSEEQKEKIKEFRSTLEEYVKTEVLKTYISKLGLKEIQDGDEKLVNDLLGIMQQTMADFTATFRQLAEIETSKLHDKEALKDKWSLDKMQQASSWEKWVDRYRDRLNREDVSEEERRSRMFKSNPVYVPRNWILQDAINDNPYEVNEEAEKRGYSSQPPSWSYGLKLSCSS
ncbi:hypothetical protein K1T71_011499 [Dendrolimus kikuchii]|uniref:Uncharacterized protein n=1 Tax=Dendrolimus kikuchii TaxID=765133 RepID=A0ACC1CP73_9NEOP|nr:hypothetical protein K1T71_011499 [Dendrolimus kikuchii]